MDLACQKYPVVSDEEKLPVLKIKELGNGINDNTDWATSNVDEKYIIESGDNFLLVGNFNAQNMGW